MLVHEKTDSIFISTEYRSQNYPKLILKLVSNFSTLSTFIYSRNVWQRLIVSLIAKHRDEMHENSYVSGKVIVALLIARDRARVKGEEQWRRRPKSDNENHTRQERVSRVLNCIDARWKYRWNNYGSTLRLTPNGTHKGVVYSSCLKLRETSRENWIYGGWSILSGAEWKRNIRFTLFAAIKIVIRS